MNWVLARLREPSTFAGLAGLALAVGLSAEEWTAISAFVAGLAGLVAMLLGDTPAE